MLAFIDKYWKVIITVLLLLNIGLLVKQEFTNNKNDVIVQGLLKSIESNNKKIEKYESDISSLKQYLRDSSGVKVIQTTIDYEKIKTAPLNTNISDKQLRDKLRQFESEYKNKRKR